MNKTKKLTLGYLKEKSRRPGLRKRRAAKSESDDETEDDMDVKTDMLMDDEEIKEDKDEEFVLEPLEARYLPRVQFTQPVLYWLSIFSGRNKK